MDINHINQQQLAQRWGISPHTLEKWRCEGIGPVFLKIHGKVLYRMEDIESYEEHCMRSSTSQAVCAGGAA